MMHTHRKRRTTARRLLLAGVLPVAILAITVPVDAQTAGGDFYSAPATGRKRAAHDDAYSPPPDKRSYLQPLGSPSGGGGGDDMWSQPPRGGGGSSGGMPGFPSSGAPSSGSGNAVMRDAIPAPVEKGGLAPVMSNDGSGLPYELWGGMDVASLEKLIATIEIPPRSPVLHDLWKKLITSPSGDGSNSNFTALRFEALYRSGLAREAAAEIAKQPAGDNPLLVSLEARNELAAGHPDKACDLVARSAKLKGKFLRG